jgi:hypothetical protein
VPSTQGTSEVNVSEQAFETKQRDDVRDDVRENSDVDTEKQERSYAEAVKGTARKCSLIDFYS